MPPARGAPPGSAAWLSFVDPARGMELVRDGACDGRDPARRRAGSDGFGYDPLFLVPAVGRTMAELPLDEKNRLSHRAAAFRALAAGWPPALRATSLAAEDQVEDQRQAAQQRPPRPPAPAARGCAGAASLRGTAGLPPRCAPAPRGLLVVVVPSVPRIGRAQCLCVGRRRAGRLLHGALTLTPTRRFANEVRTSFAAPRSGRWVRNRGSARRCPPGSGLGPASGCPARRPRTSRGDEGDRQQQDGDEGAGHGSRFVIGPPGRVGLEGARTVLDSGAPAAGIAGDEPERSTPGSTAASRRPSHGRRLRGRPPRGRGEDGGQAPPAGNPGCADTADGSRLPDRRVRSQKFDRARPSAPSPTTRRS